MADEKKSETAKDVFATLVAVDVKPYTKTRTADGGKTQLTYLSWSFAWAEVMKKFPDADYRVVKFDGVPYKDTPLGIMVYTEVTICGKTREMWLPVMNGANKPMKTERYSYKAKDYRTGNYVDRWVDAATMFDVNKAIMRCLVKNLAVFGLGLAIYAGDDIPLDDEDDGAAVAAARGQGAKNGPQGASGATPSNPSSKTAPARQNASKGASAADPAREGMRAAWNLFLTTPAAKGMDANSRSNLFALEVKQITGRDNPRAVTAEEWAKVTAAIRRSVEAVGGDGEGAAT